MIVQFMNLRRATVAIAVGMLFGGGMAGSANAVTFTGNTDNDWHKTNNWDTLAVPTSADAATVGVDGLSGKHAIISGVATCATSHLRPPRPREKPLTRRPH